VHVNAQTTSHQRRRAKVNGLLFKDRASGVEQRVDLAGVFRADRPGAQHRMAQGHGGVARHGEIVIDAKCATSVPGVFAAGDATTVPYKQIIIAAGEGAKAALSAFDHLIRTPVAA
jgi:alkyl hydroperoxide reductase subunit F